MRTRTPQIANQMMKGPRYGRHAYGSSEAARQDFLHKYAAFIEAMSEYFPRGSSAVPAVIMKCAIKYGLEKAIVFSKNVKEGHFTGRGDPAYLLYKILNGTTNYDTVGLYRRAVTAARAYCERRALTELRPASTDIFDWTEDWEPDLENKPVPIEYK